MTKKGLLVLENGDRPCCVFFSKDDADDLRLIGDLLVPCAVTWTKPKAAKNPAAKGKKK